MNRTQRPSPDECFGYHRDYVAKVPDGDIVETLSRQKTTILAFVREIPTDQAAVIHPPHGWTIRQVVEHCADAERVFGYRILRFASGDPTELPGWNENDYAASGYGPAAGLIELADEFAALRSANLALLTRLADDRWNQLGMADGRQVSVRTLAWLMAGHWLHHEQILRQRLFA